MSINDLSGKKLKSTQQSQKFHDAARELGVDLDEDELRKTLGKLAKARPEKGEKADPKDD